MRIAMGPRAGRLLIGGLVLFGLAAVPAAAPALGPDAPPELTSIAMWLEGATTFLRIGVAAPGGRVPDDVLEVTVFTPRRALFNVGLDPVVDGAFLLPLSQFNAPPGAYLVSVTDRARGTTTVNVPFDPGLALPAASRLQVIGSTVLTATGARVLDLPPTRTATVSFEAVLAAELHRLSVREATPDAEAFAIELPGTGGIDDLRTVAVPPGVLVPGRRYVIRVEAFDAAGGFRCTGLPGCIRADLRVRSTAQIELITGGPKLRLSTLGGMAAGETLVVSARVANPGPPLTVDAQGWIGFPSGEIVPFLAVTGIAIPTTGSADFFAGPVVTRTFGPADPTGHWVVGLRLIDPATGYTVAIATLGLSR